MTSDATPETDEVRYRDMAALYFAVAWLIGGSVFWFDKWHSQHGLLMAATPLLAGISISLFLIDSRESFFEVIP